MSLVRLLHRLEEGLLVALVGAMVLLAFAQIALRNLFSTALDWADPFVRLLLLWTGFLGALIATRRHRHIHIDALLRFAPTRPRHLLQGAGELFSGLVCGVLTWVAIQFLLDEREAGNRGVWDLPTWELQLIFPLTFGLMALRFFSQSSQHFLGFFRKRQP